MKNCRIDLIGYQPNQVWSVFQELCLLKIISYCYEDFALYHNAI